MNSPGVNIQISENAIRVMAVGAVSLGILWLIWKLNESAPETHLPKEAEEFSRLKAVAPSQLDDIQYDAGIVPKVRNLFDDGHYAQATEEACKHLFQIVRDVSGYNEQDGTLLINTVFLQKRILHFKATTKAHINGVETGFVEGLRYLAKSVRNLLAHDATTLSEVDALTYINLACFFSYQVKYNTVRVIEPSAETENGATELAAQSI